MAANHWASARTLLSCWLMSANFDISNGVESAGEEIRREVGRLSRNTSIHLSRQSNECVNCIFYFIRQFVPDAEDLPKLRMNCHQGAETTATRDFVSLTGLP